MASTRLTSFEPDSQTRLPDSTGKGAFGPGRGRRYDIHHRRYCQAQGPDPRLQPERESESVPSV